jgi:hypothetical protein
MVAHTTTYLTDRPSTVAKVKRSPVQQQREDIWRSLNGHVQTDDRGTSIRVHTQQRVATLKSFSGLVRTLYRRVVDRCVARHNKLVSGILTDVYLECRPSDICVTNTKPCWLCQTIFEKTYTPSTQTTTSLRRASFYLVHDHLGWFQGMTIL